MPIEQAPTKPLPSNFVPPGSRPYKVADRDSWGLIGAKLRVDVLSLVDFNFGTLKPPIVNWYLRNRVGCTKTTADGKNYVFHSSATPGIIYVPTTGAPAPMNYATVGISIEGDDDFKLAVRLILDRIGQSDTGKAVFSAIRSTGKKMVIKRFDLGSTSCTPNNRNAFAAADDARGATPKGEWYYKNDDFKTPRDERFDPTMEPSLVRSFFDLPLEPMVGNGSGSNVTVSYSPEMWGYGNACGAGGGQPGSSPSEVLLHEMVHGYRSMAGRLLRFPTVGGRRTYDNEEEFLAIVVSNVFVDDPTNPNGRRTLRADHWGFSALPPAQCSSQGFLAQGPNKRMLDKLAKSEPALSSNLKKVRGTFNPFAGL